MDINKNISIWRGTTTPPTSNHLWQKDDKLYHYDGISWKENKIDLSTMEKDGLMSKEDKEKLYNLEDKLNELNLSAYQIRGSVETLDDIPYEDLKSGDVYNILNPFYIDEKRYPEGTNVVWTGTKLDPLGGTVDFKDYSTTEEVESMISNSSNELYNRISTDQQNALNQKVDKVEGKELSTNDYTTEEKNKLQFLSNQNLFYSTSELYDLSTLSHKANLNEIRINQSIMGIPMINSVSIVVASDRAYDGQLCMRIYDMNSNLVATSTNSTNLSTHLGQHVTWYFTPIQLTKNATYRFSAWDTSGTKQTIRIHCTNNKNEGIYCFDGNDSPHGDYSPAFGINIEPIVTNNILSIIGNVAQEASMKLQDLRISGINTDYYLESGAGIGFAPRISTTSDTVNLSIYDNQRWALTGFTPILSASESKAGILTSSDYVKLASIQEGAQVNVIESVKVGDVVQEISDKQVNIPIASSDDILSILN